MVSLPDLRDARFDGLSNAADVWGRVATHLDQVERDYNARVRGPRLQLADGWQGQASDGAIRGIDVQSNVLRAASAEARNIATALDSASETMRAAQNELRAALDAAGGAGMKVADDGSVSWPPREISPAERHDPDAQNDASDAEGRQRDKAQGFSDRIGDALRKASDSDQQVAALLRKITEVARNGLSGTDAAQLAAITADTKAAIGLQGGPDESAIPKAGGDPKANAAWWASLSANDKESYIAAFPDRIGALDGLPVVDRDEANKITVTTKIAELESRKDQLSEQEKKNLAGLTELQKRIDEHASTPNSKPLYVIAIDTAGEGKYAVAVGNPDTAKHTAILVPGTTAELKGVGGEIDRIRRLQFASDMQTPEQNDVAVIDWLGYNAPEWPQEGMNLSVAKADRAQEAAVPLDHFVDGLRTTHEGDRGHMTVIGHSYGSSAVGEAAHSQHLDVDDIVSAGSPGMRTQHAADLGVGAGHVWVEAAGQDPVPRFPEAGDIVGSNVYQLGAAPQDEDYGANVMHADTEGHSNYWDPESDSLRNQADVVVGQYDNVDLDRQSPAGRGGPH
ncbi:alpha/beta hydrolase [Yinghuangia seranimata]|uniref:alpha/beta hydrolase n=1 Tax=Yinghuangia seranimata TaxID=408067 RepID=UPI00248B0344|nr:alpha/beta hydrolase [Yinghuangia seranimata]MDI2129338.1 alpha/beta hydrolase [Yinghuangia seranimata]